MAGLIVLAIVVIFVLIVAARTIRIVPQARAGVVERLGRYQRTLAPGLAIVVPFIDKVKPLIDLREQVITFAPQPVITEDNLVVQIDTVLYFTITDPKSAAYEVANPLQAIEALTVTTLRRRGAPNPACAVQGTTAVTSISTLARSSTRAATCTADMATV